MNIAIFNKIFKNFLATLLGTANEYPTKPPETDVIAVFIPISSPLVLTSAPPLFPLLTAASVWIYDSLTPSLLFKSLDFALIIPAVTVELRLNGFPTAKTHSPI